MLATGAMSRMKIEVEVVVERRVDRVGRKDQEERVTIRRRSCDRPPLSGPVGMLV